MIGRSVSARCKICRNLGILPVFLLACVTAWLASDAFGWFAGIVGFVLILFFGTISLRSGCFLLFPDKSIPVDGDYADPGQFSEAIKSGKPQELAPGTINEQINEEPAPFVEPEPAPIAEPETVFQSSRSRVVLEEEPEATAPDVISTEEPASDGNLFAEAENEEQPVPEIPAEYPGQPDDAAPPVAVSPPDEDETDETPAAVADPPWLSQGSGQATADDDPGRRLAQSLVMVGASPALDRAPSQSGGQSLRPASLQSARAHGPDNLKLIHGVGDALEELLHALGYYHFDQIAGWTPEEVRWVDENLVGFKGRVSRDQWVAQAKVLAAGMRTEYARSQEPSSLHPLPRGDDRTPDQ